MYVTSLLLCHCTHTLCHWKHMAITLQIWAIRMNGHIDQQFCIHMSQYDELQYILHILFPYSHATSIPLKCHIWKLVHVQIGDNYVSIHTSYELNAINNVTRITGIHTFHICGICLWTNIPSTLHTYAPMHYYYSLQIDPNYWIYKSKQQQQTATLFTILMAYICQQKNKPLKCHINKLVHVQIWDS